MVYLTIFMLAIRAFICEKVWFTAGIFFDISFCLCFAVYILMYRGRGLNRKIFIYPLIIAALFILNSLFSINPYNSQNEVLKLCMYMLIFVFVSLLDLNKRKLLIFSILAVSMIISLRALYQCFSGIEYINQHYSYGQIVDKGFYAIEMLKQHRVISWFASPNLLAGYLLIIVPVSLGYAINNHKQKQIKQMLFSSAVFVLSAIGLFLTRSWGAYLGFAVAICLILFNLLKAQNKDSANSGKRTKLILITVSFILIAIAMFSNRAEYFLNLNNPQNSLMQRMYYWQAAGKIIQTNFLNGIGMGNFGIIYPQFKNINANETIYAHNIFLQLWLELGTIIFLGLMAGMSYFFRNIFKAINKNKFESIGMFSAIIAFLVYNLFDFSFFVFQSAYVFIIIAACLAAPRQNEEENNKSSHNSNNIINKIIFILICSAMLIFLSQEYKSQIALDKASLLLKQGKIEAATNQGYRALKYRPNNDRIYHLLAVCAIKKDSKNFSPQAIEFYQKAITLNPNYAFYYYYMAEYYQAYKLYPEAQEACKRALEHYPNNEKFQEILSNASLTR